MSITKNTLLIILGSIIGFLFCQLFHSINKAIDLPTLPNKISVKEINNTKAIAKQKEDVLLKANDVISQKIKSNKKQLVQVQKQSIQLQTQVIGIINSNQKDTTLILKACDSLQQKVTQLVQIDNQEDSIYDEVINSLTELTCKKDSLITIQKEQTVFLKNTLLQSEENNSFLNNLLLLVQKENKRKAKCRILKIGAGIITAIFITNRIH